MYEQDVDQLDKLLELYKTYYVGNAKIKEITGKTPILGTSKHQMILSRSTYIRSAEEHKRLPIDQFKSFWLKARLKITESQQCLYFLACPSCAKSCGAAYGYEFTCFYCNDSFPGPKPLLRFQADLSDGTGTLPVYVEHREAEMLLGMTGEELIEANQEGRHFCPTDINDKFTDFQFLFQVRTSRTETRGRTFVRNTVIACLPPSEASSASRSSEEKSLSSHVQKKLLPTIPTSESQTSTSTTQQQHIPTTLADHQSSSTGKRSLDSGDDITENVPKHAKRD
ncbi:uncharacterized protein LOC142538237 [Primulina tabacum]|uniref:uncharacterized protein LOC142538237 n=1 Tax=Primulina tabacum TaxID=48773 RepID=UPI003F59CFD7